MEPVYKEVNKLTNVGYEILVCANGGRIWYLNGRRHREDGPAVEYAEGSTGWYLNGLLHRVDGPAMELAIGDNLFDRSWHLNNMQVSEEEFNEVWNCPMDKLPLYINTNLAPIAKRRLSNGPCI